MGLDQYLNITITNSKSTITPEKLQNVKETLNSLLKSHPVSDIYTVNPEYPTVELEPVVDIDGYNTDAYELFHVNGAERDYRKANPGWSYPAYDINHAVYFFKQHPQLQFWKEATDSWINQL